VFTVTRCLLAVISIASIAFVSGEAVALSTEVSLEPTRDPKTKRPTASMSIIVTNVPADCTRMRIFAQTRIRGDRASISTVSSLRVDPNRNTGEIRLRFRNMPARSSGVTEKVNFQATCTNGSGVNTKSESNGGTINKCNGERVIISLAETASTVRPAVSY
jgi:hypothetical protein